MRTIMRAALVAGILTVALATMAWASSGGGGARCHEGPSVAEGTTVVMQRSCFVGTVTYAPPGEPITFVNRDKLPHTVTGVGWDGGEIDGFARKDVSFAEEGVYVYTCVVHPGMSGAIVVGDAMGPGPAEGGYASIVQPDVPERAEPAPDPGPESSSLPGPAIGTVAGLVAAGFGFSLGRRTR